MTAEASPQSSPPQAQSRKMAEKDAACPTAGLRTRTEREALSAPRRCFPNEPMSPSKMRAASRRRLRKRKRWPSCGRMRCGRGPTAGGHRVPTLRNDSGGDASDGGECGEGSAADGGAGTAWLAGAHQIRRDAVVKRMPAASAKPASKSGRQSSGRTSPPLFFREVQHTPLGLKGKGLRVTEVGVGHVVIRPSCPPSLVPQGRRRRRRRRGRLIGQALLVLHGSEPISRLAYIRAHGN